MAELPSELITNLHVVRGTINGSPPLTWIVDTGAGTSVIDRGRAAELGLVTGASLNATTGGGSVEAVEIQGATLRLEETELPNLPLIAIDLAGLRAGLDPRIDGIIGFDLFDRYIVEFDYAAPSVRLHDPGSPPSRGSLTIPIQLRDQIPFIDIQLNSVNGRRAQGKAELDTGQTGALTLTQKFVDENGLLDPGQPTLAITTGALLPGQVQARVARLGYLRIGSVNINAPTANITPSATDAGVAEDEAGILGGEVLRRFTVLVDYSRQQIMLTPGPDLNAPIEFDMTGMSLASVTEPAPAFRIRTIIADSPAAEAGLIAGDIITAVDGRPAGELTLAGLRQQFRIEGVEIRLTLVRDGAERQVTVTTRRLI